MPQKTRVDDIIEKQEKVIRCLTVTRSEIHMEFAEDVLDFLERVRRRFSPRTLYKLFPTSRDGRKLDHKPSWSSRREVQQFGPKETNETNAIFGFLHRHPNMEEAAKIGVDHVIVDKDDWIKAQSLLSEVIKS